MISYAEDSLFVHGAPIRVQVNVGSPAGTYASSSTPFFRYIVRLNEAELPLPDSSRKALDLLGAIPHAFFDDESSEGPGWRVIAPISGEDWPVLETEPADLRRAFETARGVLWQNAAAVGITAREIENVDDEIDKILSVVDRAEECGFKMSLSYVS